MRAVPARGPARAATLFILWLAACVATAPAWGQAGSPGAAAQDGAAGEVAELLAAYRAKADELERLNAYNAHLGTLLEDQRSALARLQAERDGARDLHRDIRPLMTRMVDDLGQFLAADLPVLAAERRARVDALRTSLSDAGTRSAETFRRIIEAFQAEMELGRKIGTYRGELERDGTTQVVNFLYLGRVLLAYQSEDRSVTAFWDAAASPPGWRDLPDEYRGHIDAAMRVADRQAAPTLLRVPVPAPEAAR